MFQSDRIAVLPASINSNLFLSSIDDYRSAASLIWHDKKQLELPGLPHKPLSSVAGQPLISTHLTNVLLLFQIATGTIRTPTLQ